MKKAIAVFAVIIGFVLNFTGMTVSAEKNKNDTVIQFETLAGTDDADTFNLYRDEIVSYINKQVKKSNSDTPRMKLNYIDESLVDFNDPELVRSFKVNGYTTDYIVPADYEAVMRSISGNNYTWVTFIKQDNTAVLLELTLHPDIKDAYYLDDNWAITRCYASNLEGSKYINGSTAESEYLFHDPEIASKNITEHMDIKQGDDVKVVYVGLGDPNTWKRNYMTAGIIFVNGKAVNIYSKCFALYSDNLRDDTPESIRKPLDVIGRRYYLNLTEPIYSCREIKRLYNYNHVMTTIRMYEQYAKDLSL